MRLLMSLLLAAACALPAAASERILSYDSELLVQSDGSLLVTEHIRVRVEGQRIRRGLFRDFPTSYRDRAGNRYVVGFELLGVERDGMPEPYFTERLPNGVRINTGNDDFLPAPAEHTFTLRYRTTRQLGFFDTHDELYWNVTGLGWVFDIDAVSARVWLPGPVPKEDLRLDAYTGGQGAQGTDFQVQVTAPGVVAFRGTRALRPNEGLTVVVGFPKGLVAQPSGGQRARWFLSDNRGVLVAGVGLLALLGFYAWRWRRVGRDPDAGPVFPRYEPPADLSAGEVRMLRRMGHDNRCFAADVVQMGVRGYLDIHAEGKEWRLARRPGGRLDALSPSQRAIAERLFAGSDEVVLKNTEAHRVGPARTAQALALEKRLVPGFYVRNLGSLALGMLFSVAAMFFAFAWSAGGGVPVIVAIAIVMAVSHTVFAFLIKAPTPEGRRRMDEVEGLRMYLSVAERDEIKGQAVPAAGPEPALDAARYEALLPYALALDVESEWSRRFTLAVGVQEAQAATPSWYHGGGVKAMGLASMGSSLGSTLTQHISSSATPPGSSSGGGGGGSSGGGGGGGGGGGR
jgi:uncharacterized membrane protein YgcG